MPPPGIPTKLPHPGGPGLAGAIPASAPEVAPPVDPNCFRANELLAGLSAEVYAQLVQSIAILDCQPNQIIFEENDPGDSLYLIAQGSVKISKKGRGGQQETLAFLMARDFFGEMALIDTGRRSAQAAAADHAILGRVDRASWDLLLHLAPHEILANFMKSVTGRLRNNNQRFIEEMMRNERLSLIGTTISSIVHDMNNPIGCILGACEVIRGTSHDEVTSRMATLIRDAVQQMDAMTKELIDFSRGRTQLNLELVNLVDLVHSLEPDFAKCRARMEVRTEILYEGKLRIDRHRLLRVLANLIRNAREAMKDGEGHILRLTVKRVDASVRFQVADTGHGIPADLIPRIFEPFVTHGKSNGTGLGLAISKAVVEAHGGVISVQSSDIGTTFFIDLPLPAETPDTTNV
ncbi:MAG TPA: ATP-binding protein [Chthoniobacterales bacterium]|jgi:signal transduction histidine kinase